jgi:hypothetical protein
MKAQSASPAQAWQEKKRRQTLLPLPAAVTQKQSPPAGPQVAVEVQASPSAVQVLGGVGVGAAHRPPAQTVSGQH